jgi:hypothetical protein
LNLFYRPFALMQKGPKNQGFIKIWLKADFIPLNKKRPRQELFVVGFIKASAAFCS